MNNTKIYHIVHIDNLSSIIANGHLYADAEMRKRSSGSMVIGMNKIKERRLNLQLASHPGLCVGECVPFYFCPRSVMLYLLHMGNHPEVEYHGGQQAVVHLVFDLHKTIDWAEQCGLRWAFTNSNAGSFYFEDFADLADLDVIDWEAVNATRWSGLQDKKQAEFLVEQHFPWELVEEVGVYSFKEFQQVSGIFGIQRKVPLLKIRTEWYY